MINSLKTETDIILLQFIDSKYRLSKGFLEQIPYFKSFFSFGGKDLLIVNEIVTLNIYRTGKLFNYIIDFINNDNILLYDNSNFNIDTSLRLKIEFEFYFPGVEIYIPLPISSVKEYKYIDQNYSHSHVYTIESNEKLLGAFTFNIEIVRQCENGHEVSKDQKKSCRLCGNDEFKYREIEHKKIIYKKKVLERKYVKTFSSGLYMKKKDGNMEIVGTITNIF
jgi:hypothetical protein